MNRIRCLILFLIFITLKQGFLPSVICKPVEDSSLGLNEVAYQNELSEVYLGTPSTVRLSSGHLLASHDYFGPGLHVHPNNASVYASDDNGVTWTHVSYIRNSYWTALAVYNDMIYAIGTNTDHLGSIIIHRSANNGQSWIYNNSDDGVILFHGVFAGGATPIVIADKVMYHATEYFREPYGLDDFDAGMIICNLSSFKDFTEEEDDPIMSPKNWRLIPRLMFDKKWIPKSYPNLTAPGYLEGNVVILPPTSSQQQLRVLNVLRFNSSPLSNLAIILELNLTSYTLSFVSIIDLPGGMTKFSIRYDPVTRTYLTLCNPVTVPEHPAQRNILSLSYTNDLETLSQWHILKDRLLYDDTGFTEIDSIRYTGFHYVDWQFDRLSSSVKNASCIQWNCDGGPDIIYLIRTSYRGANTFHNSNRITYKTLPNYRDLIKQHQSKVLR